MKTNLSKSWRVCLTCNELLTGDSYHVSSLDDEELVTVIHTEPLMCNLWYYDARRKMAAAVWADDGLYGGESSQTFQAQIGRARYAQLVQGHEETDSKGQMSSRTAREVRPSDGGCWQISQSESIWINKNTTMKKIKFWSIRMLNDPLTQKVRPFVWIRSNE